MNGIGRKKKFFAVAVAVAATLIVFCGKQKTKDAEGAAVKSDGDSSAPIQNVSDSVSADTLKSGKMFDAGAINIDELLVFSDYKNEEEYNKALNFARSARLDRRKVRFDSLKASFPQKVDFEQDLNGLTMDKLLFLRNGVYAINGMYFKEENLNSYFLNENDWYGDYMCFLLEYAGENKGKGFVSNEKDVKLNDAEKRFVARIDKRIAELRKDSMYVNKNGRIVGNAAHIVNMHKFSHFGQAYMDKIAQNNFVIEKNTHEQLFHLYEQNDYARMPSFVTVDLFLQSFHMYLAYTLTKLELQNFIPAIKDLCLGLYDASMKLTGSKDAEQARIAEYNAAFFAIAYTLLTGDRKRVPEKYKKDYDTEVKRATEAGADGASNFLAALTPDGGQMPMQYSLFKPRGNYTRKPETERYFRAMTWLQKAFACRDREAHLKQSIFTAILLNTVKTAKNNKALIDVYASVFEPTVLLAGEPDNLSVMDIALFLKKENIADMSLALNAENVGKVDKMLESLAGRIVIKPQTSISCADKINFMPQRYLVDNEILQNLVDVTQNARRAFPKGLDVFHALGSAAAGDVLDNFYKEKENWSAYPDSMAKLQNKFKNFDGWNASTYNKWLECLLTLQKADKSYPVFMKTKAWDYKNLNTSLASWAELKHDFILYGEQSGGLECGGCDATPYDLPEPDTEVGYVEPNILFWNKLEELLTLTHNALAKHGLLDSELKEKTENLRKEVVFLLGVSKKELAKTPLTSDEYKRIKGIGGEIENFTLKVFDPEKSFWEWQYVQGPDRSIKVVADVYTRGVPGCPKNGILHAATGYANTIYVVVEINGYLYITRGATFSYYEFVMPPNRRLTDEEWQKMDSPAIPEWMRSIVIEKNDIDIKNGTINDREVIRMRDDVHPVHCFFRGGCEYEEDIPNDYPYENPCR
jgi:hypothetical protein